MNRSTDLTNEEKALFAALVAGFGSIRNCGKCVGIDPKVIRKLLKEGHASLETVEMFRFLFKHRNIISCVCAEFGVLESELLDKKPDYEVVSAKQVAIYLIKQHTDTPRRTISYLFGYPDDTYARKVVRKVEGYIEVDNEGIRAILERLRKCIGVQNDK